MSLAFARFRRQIALATGIAFGADKQYLVESRLAPVMRAHGLADFADLVDAFERGDNDPLMRDVIDALTTNETFFYRDRTPFENFRTQLLPSLLVSRAKERRLRFWCAACSTGQEAYSLAMLLENEAAALRGWRLDILATDLSTRAVETARNGRYSQFEVQRGLSTNLLLRHFHRAGASWRVNEHLRARIDFRDFSLLSDYAALGAFDVIFCRNVLMYFEPETKRAVLARLAGALNESGYLFLGASETAAEANAFFSQTTPDGIWQTRRRAQPQLRLA
ncbi:protein-glutamate O-methyltransferase CheR [Methylocystis sp. MJC1]|jgi:chemotaxis protein methyltransferase CheR|uniref:CheR family methyltransferase n=1 Tax=Methylocystis sp. MJC1 TaxID=2654282 RepID=UPI0013EBA9C3|nr:protein-glutamate O-methyltransferase CheR [Methylocystis sp. MJC1]KAF2990332.1 Chemotaxis protein methyltransferase Cher2 [Methylocystis sp. MJC1]MBU6528132.1 protein-glutamate O-methyltransferase CheR [Methylocystis sp. MJC1]UZX11044.1 protein-glutamate O-methyltransferase CheR [Methylocystis sp. MJC1]